MWTHSSKGGSSPPPFSGTHPLTQLAPPFLKSLFPLPCFLFHTLLRYFRQFLPSSRVRFNDSWFIFHDSSWSFANHILAENTYFLNHIEWTEHKIMVLQPANKYQIIWKCYNFKIIFMDNFHHQFLY